MSSYGTNIWIMMPMSYASLILNLNIVIVVVFNYSKKCCTLNMKPHSPHHIVDSTILWNVTKYILNSLISIHYPRFTPLATHTHTTHTCSWFEPPATQFFGLYFISDSFTDNWAIPYVLTKGVHVIRSINSYYNVYSSIAIFTTSC